MQNMSGSDSTPSSRNCAFLSAYSKFALSGAGKCASNLSRIELEGPTPVTMAVTYRVLIECGREGD
eukprot:6214037-Pleurochrysis_carterae.AAC.1